jgi:hypothetical protein
MRQTNRALIEPGGNLHRNERTWLAPLADRFSTPTISFTNSGCCVCRFGQAVSIFDAMEVARGYPDDAKLGPRIRGRRQRDVGVIDRLREKSSMRSAFSGRC